MMNAELGIVRLCLFLFPVINPEFTHKTQKTCLIFGYVIFLLYLCTRFRKKVVMVYI